MATNGELSGGLPRAEEGACHSRREVLRFSIMDDREWLARRFEDMLAPAKVDEALSDRAYAHFNELLLAYGTEQSVDPEMSTDGDAALQLDTALRRATARAVRETAAALRSGKL